MILTLFLTLALSSIVLTPEVKRVRTSSTLGQPRLGLDSALTWLVAHEGSNGSYGDNQEFSTAAAAYALWLNDSTSSSVSLAYTYLGHQLNDNSTWFWGRYGEADIPGELLFSISITQNLGEVNSSAVKSNLLSFQESNFRTTNGGFDGYLEYINGNYRRVASSVDTSMAIWGLSNAELIPDTNRTAAANYLLTLQNSDGSFALTENIAADPVQFQPRSTSCQVLPQRASVVPDTFTMPLSLSLHFWNVIILERQPPRWPIFQTNRIKMEVSLTRAGPVQAPTH